MKWRESGFLFVSSTIYHQWNVLVKVAV